MSFDEWLDQNQYDIDFGNDTIDLMRVAYVAGLKYAVESIVQHDLYGNETIVELKRIIEESE
jgi:hypothetical protein